MNGWHDVGRLSDGIIHIPNAAITQINYRRTQGRDEVGIEARAIPTWANDTISMTFEESAVNSSLWDTLFGRGQTPHCGITFQAHQKRTWESLEDVMWLEYGKSLAAFDRAMW